MLERLLRAELIEEVLGDLEERHARIAELRGAAAAARWYRAQGLLLCLRPALLRIAQLQHVRPSVHGALVDVRLALRGARKEPVATAAIVLSLALGIGALTAAFSAVDRFLVRMPDGIARPDRVVEVFRLPDDSAVAAMPGYDGYLVIGRRAFDALLEQSVTLRGGALLSSAWPLSVRLEGIEPERMHVHFVSENYFGLLGVAPALGRAFDPATDSLSGAAPVVVITDQLWRRRFAADPRVVGRSLELEGREFTIVGVAPPEFVGTSVARQADFWAPLSAIDAIPVYGRTATANMFIGIARLRDGVTLAQVNAELARIGREVLTETGAFRALPLTQVTVDPNRRALFRDAGTTLFAAVAVILLIACLNVANLLLVRSARRRRELAVRVALGAGRGRLVRQLFTESTLLFVTGSAGGLGFFIALRPWLAGLHPPHRFFFTNPTLELPFDGRVAAFALLTTGLAAGLFGALPAFRAARTHPHQGLQGAVRGTSGGISTRDVLLVLQVSFSLIALAAAGLFTRGMLAALRIDLGFESEGVGMVSLNLHYPRYSRDEQHAYYRRAVEEARAIPGVEAVAISRWRPLEFAAVGRLASEEDGALPLGVPAPSTSVSPGYFETVGIPILAGRDFGPDDHSDTGTPSADVRWVVVINERGAELVWPGDPIQVAVGRTLRVNDTRAEVIGVVPTGRHFTLGEEPTPYIYGSLEQQSTMPTATLFFRTRNSPEALLDVVADRIRAIDPGVHVHDVEPARALVSRAMWRARVSAGLVGALGCVGLLLAVVGIYGVVTSAVGERRRELGIRIALGAAAARVTREVVGRALWVVLVGVGFGTLAVRLSAPAASSLLYGIPPSDPIAIGGACAVLMIAALFAAWLPARRAGRVDPLEVIRAE
jgi:predicted permease